MNKFIASHVNPFRLSSDCLDLIFLHFKNDKTSLYSFILVNRHFCRLVIPLLWSHPFEYVSKEKAPLIIQTYVSCLSDIEKEQLIAEDIIFDNSSRPLFNYSKYLQSYESHQIRLAIEKWLRSLKSNTRNLGEKTRFTYQLLGNLIFSNCYNLRELTYHWNEEFNTINLLDITSFSGFRHAIGSLKTFKFEYCCFPTQITGNLFAAISQCTRNIHHLSINTESDLRPEITKAILQFIQSQSSIKILSINMYSDEDIKTKALYKAIQFHSHSLTHLKLDGVNEFNQLLKLLMKCKKLQTLELRGFDPEDIPDLFDLPITFINIQDLYCMPCMPLRHDITPTSQIHMISLTQLLKMSNQNLKTFTFLSNVTPDLMKAIEHYCPNLTHLSIAILSEHFIDFYSLLLGLPKLEALSLKIYPETLVSSIFSIQDFTDSIPPTLQSFGINFHIPVETLEILLYNLQRCSAKISTLTFYSSLMVTDEYLRIITRYAQDCGGHFREFRYVTSRQIGSESFSLEELKKAKDSIPIVGVAESFYTPFYGKVL
ncbi:41030_t:CDS:1 [Gigaspora margarita]|uniref:41030_t:CDS:1 n=1 Tax=Gigaspora margarita TaxID=4874 RepID=A0ABN7VCV4_GIGMA|nr:41030_t:CDS:1 [Gigaspora margarita]